MTEKTYQTTLLIRGDSRNAVRSVRLTSDELAKLTGAQRTGTTATQRFTAAFRKTNTAVGNATRSFSGLQGIIGALGLGKLVSETIEAANTYASLQGQLKLVTGSQEELNSVYGRALALSNETGQSTEATVKLYARLARSTEELDLAQEELFAITKAVNQSFVVSGAASQEAAAATLQFSQGLASGVLRGEELNSVLENSPRLARAIADGLGVTIGQLREMGKAGELTAEAVTGALLDTADTIESEFNEMPLTVSRVMQTLSNDVNDALGQVDTAPLIESVEDLRAAISDPAFKEGITNIAGGLLDIVTNGAKAATTMGNLAKFIGEEFAAAVNGIATDDIPRLEDALEKANEQLRKNQRFGFLTADIQDKLRIKIAKLEAQLESARKMQGEYGQATKKTGEASAKATPEVDKLADAIAAATKQHERNTAEFEKGYQELDKLTRKNREYVAALEYEVAALNMTEREQAIQTALRRLDTHATEEQKAKVVELAGALYDEAQANKAVTESTKEAVQAIDPFAEALQGTAERIDSVFADAWRGAFDSFSDFADGLKEAFKNLLAELANLAITRPIVMNIAGAFGLGGGSAAASAAGGASLLSGGGSLLGLLRGGVTGGLSSLGGAYGAAGNFFGAGTTFGNAALEQARLYQFGSVGQGLANLGLSLGAGVLGGFAGNQVFGSTSGIGATLGGLGGSVFGPLGAGAGAFLGSGAEKLLGNVFGFGGKGGNQAGFAQFDLATGALNAQGIGKSFDQANVDTASGIAQVLQQFANVLGGSSFSGRIKVGNRSGIKLDGQRFGSPEELFQAVFDDIIAGASNLDATLRSLISGFQGTAEETIAFSQAVLSLNDAAGINTVTEALKDFNAEQPSAYRGYELQTSALRDMIASFDGSAGAASALNAALLENKTAAYEMALSIKSIGAAISETAAEQARNIRESVMSAEDLRQSRREELNSLRASLGSMTDPEMIAQTSERILELNRLIFDSLGEVAQQNRAESFATLAEQVAEQAERRLDVSLQRLQSSQEDTNRRVAELLSSSGNTMQEAANTSLAAANTMLRAAQALSLGGTPQPAEVVS